MDSDEFDDLNHHFKIKYGENYSKMLKKIFDKLDNVEEKEER